jgi:hypothetical protein
MYGFRAENAAGTSLSMSFSLLVSRGPDIQFPTLTMRTNLYDNNDIKGSHSPNTAKYHISH